MRRTLPFALLSLAVLPHTAHSQEVVFEEVYNATFPTELLGIDDVEITPDGRYAVARDNTELTSARIYDLTAPGPPVVIHKPINGTFSGACQDGVAVTNERAVVLGSKVLIIDLTAAGLPLLLEEEVGEEPRDVVITPDGTKAIVRGGNGPTGGIVIYDLATATRLASHPGEIGDSPMVEFAVDSAVADNAHAVTLSLTGTASAPTTRVTVWDLQPAGGGAPAVVFETGPGTDLLGEPHDIALAPNGQHAAVRSIDQVARIELAQSASGIQWVTSLWNSPGPLGGSALDSIEMTDDTVVAISRRNGSQGGMQVDLWDAAGNQSFGTNTGDPHDLLITPDGSLAVVRSSFHVMLWDLANLPTTSGTQLLPLDQVVLAADSTGLQAGFDSLAVTSTRVVAMAAFNMDQTRVRGWDISAGTLEPAFSRTMPSWPLDLTITPDESKAVVVGLQDILVLDMITGTKLLEEPVAIAGGGYSWCDGVVATNDSAVAFGTQLASGLVFGGWITQLDLFNDPQRFCSSTPNSTGAAAQLYVTGSADSVDNNLRLVASDLPQGEFGAFFYGDMVQNLPFGNGFNCAGGQVALFDVQTTNAAGNAVRQVDNTDLPAGGGNLAAGTTWHFQYLYRDSQAVGPAQFNLSDAISVLFE